MSLYTRYGENEVVSNEAVAEVTVDPIRAFYIACEAISTEAAEMGNIAGWFARKGASTSMAIQNGFEKLTTFNWAPLATLHPNAMQTIMRTHDYMEIQDKPVNKPRGFVGNLAAYVEDIAPRILMATQLKQNVVDPAIHRLGHYVTNAKERNDRRDFVGGSADIAQVAGLLANEAKWFNGSEATANFGELFANNAEVVKAEYKMVEYGKMYSTSSPTQLLAAVQQLNAVASGLFKTLSSDRDPASKQLVQMVGQELGNVAKWVEWYAMQVTRLTEVNQVFATLENEFR